MDSGYLFTKLSFSQYFTRTVGHAVTIRVAIASQSIVAGANQIVAVEEHPASAGNGLVAEQRRSTSPPVVIVMQRLDMTAPGHHDLEARAECHRIDVVSQFVTGVE